MVTKRKAKPAPKRAAKASPTKALLDPKAKITVKADGNPKRKGTAAYKRFAKYQSGQTVEAALAKGLQRRDINYDLQHGFIQVAA